MAYRSTTTAQSFGEQRHRIRGLAIDQETAVVKITISGFTPPGRRAYAENIGAGGNQGEDGSSEDSSRHEPQDVHMRPRVWAAPESGQSLAVRKNMLPPVPGRLTWPFVQRLGKARGRVLALSRWK